MKTCPNCNQTFGEDNDFCLNDGTRLVAGSESFMSSGEMPTQYIPLAQNAPYQPIVVSQSSKWVFPLVGVLCGLVVVLGFFAFFRESSSDKPAVPLKNTEVGESNKNIEIRRSPQVESTPVPQPTPPSVKPAEYPVVTVNSPRDGYLALKSEPCAAPCGTMLLKIPHGTGLSLATCKDNFEVADRRRGRWCYTSYGGYTGWIFDAFVAR